MAAHLLKKYAQKIPLGVLRFVGNIWFPYLGSGIKVTDISSDYRRITVILKRRWYNSNYVGTQFGGSIYSMTDPFYMLALINNLGNSYIVWDKAAQIEFIKPGRTQLSAVFEIDEMLLETIKEKTQHGDKYIFDLRAEVKDTNNEIVAVVIKTLYVRKKRSEALGKQGL